MLIASTSPSRSPGTHWGPHRRAQPEMWLAFGQLLGSTVAWISSCGCQRFGIKFQGRPRYVVYTQAMSKLSLLKARVAGEMFSAGRLVQAHLSVKIPSCALAASIHHRAHIQATKRLLCQERTLGVCFLPELCSSIHTLQQEL